MPNYTVDILNNIRLNASQEYQNRIPEATRNNISTIGQAFETYTPLYNEFADALINKIGKTIVLQKMANNKLARFKAAGVVSPLDVEEIFVEMAKAEGSYDPEGPNPLGRRETPDIKVYYHRRNRQDYYAVSVGDIDFSRTFRSEATVDAFLRRIINSMYSGDAHDEWLAMKNVVATYDGYFDYQVAAPSATITKEEFAKGFVKTLRKAVNDLSFTSNQYNAAGVFTRSEASELVLLVHKDVCVEVDVERLATAFHQSETDIKVVPTILTMDDFGSMTNTYAVLVDREWFKIYDTLFKMEGQRNAQGLFTNYFLHHHQILSASKFANAVRLVKA